MAENSEYEEEEEEEEGVEEQDAAAKKRKKEENKKKKKRKECKTSRIDELSKPKRWILLGTFREFGCLFEPDRLQAIKEKVQELFSMTPEETELYFSRMEKKKPQRLDLRTFRKMVRKEKAAARKEAFQLFCSLIKKSMKYAFKHAPPLLVTPMLRIVSDHVLEVLCSIHTIELPKRTDTTNMAQFLIAIADWTAILVANIYYELEVEDREEIERSKRLVEKASDESDVSKKDDKKGKDDKNKGKAKDKAKDKSKDKGKEKETGVTDYEKSEGEEGDEEDEAKVESEAADQVPGGEAAQAQVEEDEEGGE